ncbi:MAG: TraR/DksA family transcriptional regulator [Candidatus Magasanikbacteria bacterium]|nr:TraR/DksA family transcriptional regulator [Candidatus Magasanikbacteria bacterium]
MHDPKFVGEIKEKLLKDKTRLERELSKFTRKNPKIKGDFEANYPEYGDDEDDNVQEMEQYAVNKPLEINLEKLLRDVNKALTSIEKRSYGICKYCDKPIDKRRLRARPTSGSCVSCKKTIKEEA